MSDPQRQFRWKTEPKTAKPPKPEPESWTITFTPAGSSDIPPICRIRRILKMAWRSYGLKAKIVAGPPVDPELLAKPVCRSCERPITDLWGCLRCGLPFRVAVTTGQGLAQPLPIATVATKPTIGTPEAQGPEMAIKQGACNERTFNKS